MHHKIAKKVLDRGGITLQLHGNNLADAAEVAGDYWYYPILPDCTVIVNEYDLPAAINAFVAADARELQRPNRYLGIWKNPSDNQYYIDVNERSPTKAHAIKRVKQINAQSKRQILAIYNPAEELSSIALLN